MFTTTAPNLAELGERIGLTLHSAGVSIAATPTVATDADAVTVTVPVAGGDPLRSVLPHLDALLTATSTLRVTGTSADGDRAVVTLSSAPMVSAPTLLGDVESFTVGGSGSWHGMITHYRAQGAVARAKPIANTSSVGRRVLNPLAMVSPLRPMVDTAPATPASDAAVYLPYLSRLLDLDVYRSVMKDAGVSDASTVPVAGDAKVAKLIATVLPTLQHAHVGPRGLELTFAANPTGTSLANWEKGVPSLSAAMGVDPSNVTVTALPDGRIVFCTGDRDPLASAEIGDSLTTLDTLHIGVKENGDPAVFALRSTPSILLSGLPDTGKTAAALSLTAQLVATRPVHLIVGDGKESGDLDTLGTVAESYVVGSGVAERGELADALDTALAAASRRAKHFRTQFGTANYWDISSVSRPPLIVVLVDEVHRYLSGTAASPEGKAAKKIGALLQDLVTGGRSLGVLTILATQRPSAKSIDADLRESITAAVALRQSASTARMSLGDMALLDSDPRLDPSLLPAGVPGRAIATVPRNSDSGDTAPLSRVQLIHLVDDALATAVSAAVRPTTTLVAISGEPTIEGTAA